MTNGSTSDELTDRELVAAAFSTWLDAMADRADPVAAAARRAGHHSPTSDDRLPESPSLDVRTEPIRPDRTPD